MTNRFNFRAWDKQMGVIVDLTTDRTLPDIDEGDDIVLMQSTGLVDMNGEEVFEGDIVDDEYGGGTYPIIWSEDTASFCFDIYGEEFRPIQPDNLMQVVGNIYDNPELLGGYESKKGQS